MQSRCAAPPAARAAARPALLCAPRTASSAICVRPASIARRTASAVAFAKKRRGRGGSGSGGAAESAGSEPSLDELERYLREQARPGGGSGKTFDAPWKLKGGSDASGASSAAASSSSPSSKAARRAARALEAELQRSGAYEDGVESAYEDEDAFGYGVGSDEEEYEAEERVSRRRGGSSSRSRRGAASALAERPAGRSRGGSRRGVPAEVEYGYDDDEEEEEEEEEGEYGEDEEEEEEDEEDEEGAESPPPLTLYLDSADVGAVERFASAGLLAGVTTNPAILRKDGVPCRLDALGAFVDACEQFGVPEVQLQTWGSSAEALVRTGLALARLSPAVVVKVPATAAGYEAAGRLVAQGVLVTLTAVHGVGQALAAAALGAAYVAPYVGRIGDAARDPDAGLLAAVEMHRMLHHTHATVFAKGDKEGSKEEADASASSLTCLPISEAIEGAFGAASAPAAGPAFRASGSPTAGAFLLGPAVPSRTEILAASVRSAQAALRLAAGGVRTMTLSPAVLSELVESSLTDRAAEAFERDVEANS